MTFTGENELVRILLPIAETIRPTGQLMQAKAAARALTQDGYIDPGAILPGSGTLVDFNASSVTMASSDTVNPVKYIGTTITLPDGVWRVKARGQLTGWLSTSSNMNVYVKLNSTLSTNFQIPMLAVNNTSTAVARLQLDEVEGELELGVWFRPSAGTLTIEAGDWLYRAERLRT